MSELLTPEQETNNFEGQKVFASDMHGDHKFAQALVDQFPGAELHVIGDTMHPKNLGDTKQTIEILKNAQANFYLGNGEDVIASTLFINDEELRLTAIKEVFIPMYTGGIFASYDIQEPHELKRQSKSDKDLLVLFDALRYAIINARHIGAFLCPLFYEDKDNVAIHGGVDSTQKWRGKNGRRAKLLNYGFTALEDRNYQLEPVEIFDPGHILSQTLEVPGQLGRKNLITGHDDYCTDNPSQRLTGSPYRIRIARGRSGERYAYVLNSGVVTPVVIKS